MKGGIIMVNLTDIAIIHQCAWCNGIMVDGVVIEKRAEKIDGSHGICKTCKSMILGNKEDMLWSEIVSKHAPAVN